MEFASSRSDVMLLFPGIWCERHQYWKRYAGHGKIECHLTGNSGTVYESAGKV